MASEIYKPIPISSAPQPRFSPLAEDVEAPEMREAVYQKVTKPTQDRARATADAATAKPQGSFLNGGTVKKTGMYKLHAGERVLSTKQRKKFKL